MSGRNGVPKKKARYDREVAGLDGDTDLFADPEQGEGEVDDDDPMLSSQPASEPCFKWTVEDLARRLVAAGVIEDDVQKFKDHAIDGSVLCHITPEFLSDKLGIKRQGSVLKIQDFICKLGCNDFDSLHPDGSKVFNDPVHGHMEFHPLCVAIIDTPQFQRLRYLKQLGACYFVYPGAAHNRFEHCLGVSFLAGQLAGALKRRQPRLDITDKDILCVQIAGLCHDLGHGPFSHLFDSKFIPYLRKDKEWEHEEASIAMFDYMVQANNLEAKFEEYGVNVKDRTFIKEQIQGKMLAKDELGEPTWQYGKDKQFLYEIVANKRNGVDVDKWDYFLRDCHHLGIHISFDHSRFIQFSRVIRVEGELQICVRDKEAFNMYQMFHTRHALHRKAYQHKVVQAVEIMLVEAMMLVNDFITIPGDNGKRYKMSECIDHMDAYTNLTDSIFHLILLSEVQDPKVKQAQEILRNIQRRHLHKCVGESVPISVPDSGIPQKNGPTIKEEILEILSKTHGSNLEGLHPDRVVIQMANLDFGKKEKNPLNDLRFFSKDNLNNAVAVKASEVSSMLPQVLFKERLVRVFLRPSDDKDADKKAKKLLQQAFKDWCATNTMQEPTETAWLQQTPVSGSQSQQSLSESTPPPPASRTKETPRSAMKARQELTF